MENTWSQEGDGKRIYLFSRNVENQLSSDFEKCLNSEPHLKMECEIEGVDIDVKGYTTFKIFGYTSTENIYEKAFQFGINWNAWRMKIITDNAEANFWTACEHAPNFVTT